MIKIRSQRRHPGRLLVIPSLLLALSLVLPAAETASAQQDGKLRRSVKLGQPGTWGTLESYEMRLEPPLNYASAAMTADRKELVWRFPGQNAQSIVSTLSSTGLTGTQIAEFTDPSRLSISVDGVEIRPPFDRVIELDPQVRSRLYELLKEDYDDNLYQYPYVLDPLWFDEAKSVNGIRSDVVEMVRKLSYLQEAVTVFADMPLLLAVIPDPDEELRVVRSMLRERSLAVRLCLDENSDLPSLGAYWSAGGRNRDIMPILESALNTDDVDRLDVVHLLPPLARMLLYTYPSPRMAVGTSRPDCFWTTANFFRYDPSDRYLDVSAFQKTLFLSYEEVSGPPEFGDAVMVVDDDTQIPLHACNYLADGLVFTKNGRSFSRPWVIDTLENVMAGYLKVPNVRARFFRQKSTQHTLP